MSEADFKMIRPVTITDAILTSTNIPETLATTYVGGTTYSTGNIVGTTPVYGSAQSVYESVQDGNVGHSLTDTDWWKYIGIVYPPYNYGASCNTGGIVSSISTDVHLLYESLVDSNTGNLLSDTTKWLEISSTNARAMFDPTYGSQAENADSIVMVLTPGTIINSIFLGNLSASTVRVEQSGSGYTKTVELNSHPVLDWYSWWYEDILRTVDVAITDIPPYPNSTITISITEINSTVKIGLLVLGKSVTIGLTQWEIMGGIISYSGTTTDSFGNTTFLKRANAKKLNFDVLIKQGFESEAFRLLTLYTDVPMVFIGSSAYQMTMAYGYLGEWQIPVSNSGRPAPIEIRGLI